VTPNPTVGKLKPGVAPVSPIRPAQPSPSGKGFDPAASGKEPANTNMPHDVGQAIVKPTADGHRPDNLNEPRMGWFDWRKPKPPAKGPAKGHVSPTQVGAPSKPESGPKATAHPYRPLHNVEPAPSHEQVPKSQADLAHEVADGLHELSSLQEEHGAYQSGSVINDGFMSPHFRNENPQIARQYQNAVDTAEQALHAYNKAGEQPLKAQADLSRPLPANSRVPLQLNDLQKMFPELAKTLETLHTPTPPRGAEYRDVSLEDFDRAVRHASSDWGQFVTEATSGQGITPQLVDALIRAEQSFAQLERSMKPAAPHVADAWQARIAQAKQAFDGYIAQAYLDAIKADLAYSTVPHTQDNRVALTQRSKKAHRLLDKLRSAFKVQDLGLAPVPRSKDNPLLTYELFTLQQKADKAFDNLNRSNFANDKAEYPMQLFNYLGEVQTASAALRDIEIRLKGLDHNRLIIPDIWNRQMTVWHDVLNKTVEKLHMMEYALKDLIREEEGKPNPSKERLSTQKARLSAVQRTLEEYIKQDKKIIEQEVN
jgi:hypothetical protein